jgi:hypothetical protein
MTKKKLLAFLESYPDDAEVVIEVHDTSLHEDLYDFYVDGISWTRIQDNQMKHCHELRLTAINHHDTSGQPLTHQS